MMQQLILTNLQSCSRTSVPLAEPSKEGSLNFKETTRRKQQTFFVEMDTKWRCDEMSIDIETKHGWVRTCPFTTRWMKL